MQTNHGQFFDNNPNPRTQQSARHVSPCGWHLVDVASYQFCDDASPEQSQGLLENDEGDYSVLDYPDRSPEDQIFRDFSPHNDGQGYRHSSNASLLVSFSSDHDNAVDVASVDNDYRSGSMELGSGPVVNTPAGSEPSSPQDAPATMAASMSTTHPVSMAMAWPQQTAPSQATSMVVHASSDSLSAPTPFVNPVSQPGFDMHAPPDAFFDLPYMPAGIEFFDQTLQPEDLSFPMGNFQNWAESTGFPIVSPDEYTHLSNTQQLSQAQSDTMNASMPMQAASIVASSASSPHNASGIEQRQDQASRKRKGRSKANSSQASGMNVFRLSPSSTSESEQSRATNDRVGKKPRGGRQRGSHLPSDKKQQAKERRELIACWVCALQRDVCISSGPNEPCTRCAKRMDKFMSPGSNELACVTEHLYAYVTDFVPVIFDKLHNRESLQGFVRQHIKELWLQRPICINIDPASGGIPIDCIFYEFEPKGEEVLKTREGVHDKDTNQWTHMVKRNLPLSLKHLEDEDARRFNEYFDNLARDNQYMQRFPAICYRDPPDDFLKRLLQSMMSYAPEGKKEIGFVRSVNKMLLLMYSFSRACLIPQNQRHKFARLRQTSDLVPESIDVLPRMASRQLKFLFLGLLREAVERVLKSVDNLFRTSKSLWTIAFYGMLGLAMAFEAMETSVATYLQTDVRIDVCSAAVAQSQLLSIANAIEDKFRFLHKLFLAKFKISPFDYGRSSSQGDGLRQKLGAEGAQLVLRVQNLMREKYESQIRFGQSICVTLENPQAYCGRLVAQFLSSFVRLE